MRDSDVREELHRSELATFHQDPHSVVVDELGILHGFARVDVVVVNGKLHGYEIKSERDTLKRLSEQISYFGEVLDSLTLVVAERHLDKALQLLPSWWGVLVAASEFGRVRLEEYRPAGENPGVLPSSVAELLWRDEALDLLEQHGVARGLRSKPRDALYAKLVEILPPDELRRTVRDQLKCRLRRASGRRG